MTEIDSVSKVMRNYLKELDIKNDSLQNIYTEIYNSTSRGSEWNGSAIQYLSNFPKEEHKAIFKDIIYQEDSDYSRNIITINLRHSKVNNLTM